MKVKTDKTFPGLTVESRETPAYGTQYRWVWNYMKGPWKDYDWEVFEDGVFIVKQIIKHHGDFKNPGNPAYRGF